MMPTFLCPRRTKEILREILWPKPLSYYSCGFGQLLYSSLFFHGCVSILTPGLCLLLTLNIIDSKGR